MVDLKRHIHQISQQRNTRSLQNLTINLNARNYSPWSEATSVWNSWHDTPPPPYTETDCTPSSVHEPPPSYESTNAERTETCCAQRQNSRSFISTNRHRRRQPRFSQSFSNHLPVDSPDFNDLSSDYYFVSPLECREELQHNQDSIDTRETDTDYEDTCHTYVNLRERPQQQPKAVFSPSFNTMSSSASDELVFDCVRQLVFDMTQCSDLVDSERESRCREAVSQPVFQHSAKPVRVNRRISRHTTKNFNQTIDSDCSEFFQAAMTRPAVTHKKKVDRVRGLAKQMKLIRKKLLKHGTMQDTNMDTLAVL